MACYTRSSAMFTIAAAAAAAIVALLMVGETRAQDVPSCAANLIPCAAYLNSTAPPASCCNPLRETITNQRDCLCSLYNNPSLIQSLGINVTQALELPKYCGVSADTGLCSNVTASAPAPTDSSTPPPPAVAGRDDSNVAGKMAWAGAPSLLLLWVSMVAY